jgi:6-pyruvoyltetrahydropterin/6-carboxytetrahydropterin synthase
MFLSTKEYGHEIGLSACFRQWKAHSHCNQLHGYALAVKFTFGALELDNTNWVVDFGSMKSLKSMLQDTFDHTLLVAEDDPKIDILLQLDRCHGVAKVVVVPACGCEKFAEIIFECAEIWLKDNGFAPRVKLLAVEVKEHGANSAIKLAEGAPV